MMPSLGCSWFSTTLVVILLSSCAATAQETDVGPCLPVDKDASGIGLVSLTRDCRWAAPIDVGTQSNIRIIAGRGQLQDAGTTTVFADEQRFPRTAGALTGFRLLVERMVLVGFSFAGPGDAEPFLWPAGVLQQRGTDLNLTDTRLITNNKAVFDSWLRTIATDDSMVFWTDNSTFLHVPYWTDGSTTLVSVGLLLQAAAAPLGPAQLPPPLVGNCVIAATNSTLVPALEEEAAVVTPEPLLVYITTNVSLGLFPALPKTGLSINRPVVLVGLRTLITSVDFQMVVNQLNATGSRYSNVTFVSLVLENLAPGDGTTSAMAAPFSIAISNNVWAVYYNRTAANDTRLAFFNTTLVVPRESEMAYVTYMFTMYTSPLPYLRQQTSFYSDVLHMSVLQFTPGPGTAAITVNLLKSWFHWWNSLVLTTKPAVAEPMPVPKRPVDLDTTRPSPLVQAVHSAQNLKAAGEQGIVGNRAHILLLLSNVSFADMSSPINLGSVMSWMGSSQSSADTAAMSQKAAQPPGAAVSVSFGYRRSVVVMGQASDNALQLQQLTVDQLPQGLNESAAPAASRFMPQEVWTILLWSIERPMKGKPLSLDGVAMQLPRPELSYLQAAAAQSTDFVVPLEGADVPPMTFQTVSCLGDGCLRVHVGALQGPGMVATNLTLSVDPDAETVIPGYYWPAQSEPPTAIDKGGLAPWAVAVVATCVSAVAIVAVVGGFLLWRHRRQAANKQALLDPSSKLEDGSSPPCSCSGLIGGAQQRRHKDESVQLMPELCSQHCMDCEKCVATGTHSKGTADSVSDMPDWQGMTGATQIGTITDVGDVAPVIKHSIVQKTKQGSQQGVDRQERQPQVGADVTGIREPATPQHSTDKYADNIAAGLQRWRAAVSSTTMLLMERRMDAAAGGSTTSAGHRAGSGDLVADEQQLSVTEQQQQNTERAGSAGQMANSCLNSTPPQLQLSELLGEGSFGCVYLGNWRGKRVAVKVMHLPASALLSPQNEASQPGEQAVEQGDQQADLQDYRRQKRARQKQQNSPPHMAIMEAVLSSTMSHPNVVQVYTYALCPLTSTSAPAQDGSLGSNVVTPSPGPHTGENVSGWELKLIMEYCNEGSVRDALDCGLLCSPGSYMAPSAVLELAHDVAAAMLHLHSEGIVHGDLKAGNVMLTGDANKACTLSNGKRVWSTLAGQKLTAKVADFGLAMPLDPSDTHATLLARGTPTHMSPELFMSGHVSKASDVYAYGILLYEIITGQRAYAGVPIPLLPHEVARQGLRPTWPDDLPSGCCELRKLAEACWAAKPQDRPSFGDILCMLDYWAAGGTGWPEAAAFSASPLFRSNSAGSNGSREQPSGALADLGQMSAQQQHARQQAHALAPLMMESKHQQQCVELSTQQHGNATNHAAVQGAAGEASPDRAPSPDEGAAGHQGDKVRKMHMSWSEVDVR